MKKIFDKKFVEAVHEGLWIISAIWMLIFICCMVIGEGSMVTKSLDISWKWAIVTALLAALTTKPSKEGDH